MFAAHTIEFFFIPIFPPEEIPTEDNPPVFFCPKNFISKNPAEWHGSGG
jgi:hypothetical protein